MNNLKSYREIHGLYLKAYRTEVFNLLKGVNENPDIDTIPFIKKIVTYGIKAINLQYRLSNDKKCITRDYTTRELVISKFKCNDFILSLIGELTPREFMSLFPIRKIFDGDKYQTKDYFYTRDYMNKLDQDNPMKYQINIMELLWEYMNWEITMFNVAVINCIDDLRKLDGQPSMIMEFCKENGIGTHTMYTDEKGKKFLVDDETGKSKSVKTRPSYLKVKIGGKQSLNSNRLRGEI